MVTCQVLATVVLYCTHMMTVPMHTLPPSAERRHHKWPPWARFGLVMKPLAGRIAWVTPRQPAMAVFTAVFTAMAAVVAAVVVAVVVLDRPAVMWVTPGASRPTAAVMSTAASHLAGSRLRRAPSAEVWLTGKP